MDQCRHEVLDDADARAAAVRSQPRSKPTAPYVPTGLKTWTLLLYALLCLGLVAAIEVLLRRGTLHDSKGLAGHGSSFKRHLEGARRGEWECVLRARV